MHFIHTLIATHTVFGLFGQVSFLTIAALIRIHWRKRMPIPAYLQFATALPAILGAAASYTQIQTARSISIAENSTGSDLEGIMQTIPTLFWIGIACSGFLVMLCLALSAQDKKRLHPNEPLPADFAIDSRLHRKHDIAISLQGVGSAGKD